MCAVGAVAHMCPWAWVDAQHLMELSSLSFEVGSSSGEELTGASEYEMGSSPVQALLCCLIAGLAVAGVLTCTVSIWHQFDHKLLQAFRAKAQALLMCQTRQRMTHLWQEWT